ncbi:MAG: hypothetical protein ACJKTH_03305 [Patescibacteria group bacterium UBA2163]
MKSNKHTLYISTVLLGLFVFTIPFTTHAQEYYECQVSVKASMRDDVTCRDYLNFTHRCQIYDKKYSGSGVPNFCSSECLNRSDIPRVCADVIVQRSNNPEAHEKRNAIEKEGKDQIEDQLGVDIDQFMGTDIEKEVRNRLEGIENEINTEDGIDSGEIQYITKRIVAVIRDILGEKVGGVITGTKEKIGNFGNTIKNNIPIIGNAGDDELTEEDFEDHSIEATGFNEFRTEKWPDDDGTKIAKIVDPYGIERYTSDGKHFYDNAYDAAHSQEGFSNMVNTVGDAWEGFTGIFSFRTKLKDGDKELQREIAREVLNDAQNQREKDIEKAYEKLSGQIKTPTLGNVPAKAVIEVAKEASATDFAGGALLYIEQREEGKSPATIKTNLSEELSEGYGTFGRGVSLSTTNKDAPAVLFARYEETYQRYLLAKEFGRKE